MLFKLLTNLKRRKHFHGLWSDFVTPGNWMKSGDVVIESIWAATISPLAALGFPVRQAAPREGYRAFAGIYSISNAVTDPAKLRACYDFINWWHSGYAGAETLRSGYLNAVAAPSRRFMPADEYAYWLEGKPAAMNYKSPSGDIVARKGHVTGRRPVHASRLPDRELELLAERSGPPPAALVRVRLDHLGRSDGDPHAARTGRDSCRVAADRDGLHDRSVV